MEKPNTKLPSTSMSTPPYMPIEIQDPSIRGDSYNQLANNRGVRFLHRKAILCPNVVSFATGGHLPNCQLCNADQMIYYDAKEIVGYFSSNSQQKIYEYMGSWDVGQATVSFPTEYADGTEFDISPMDKIQILDFTARIWEQLEYSPTKTNTQTLTYPIKKIDLAISAKDNKTFEYKKDVDFTITEDGKILWIKGRTPTYNKELQVGEVISFSYYANPVYIVLYPLKEVRASQEMGPDGVKVAKRLPQSVIVKRDNLFNNMTKENNPSV